MFLSPVNFVMLFYVSKEKNQTPFKSVYDKIAYRHDKGYVKTGQSEVLTVVLACDGLNFLFQGTSMKKSVRHNCECRCNSKLLTMLNYWTLVSQYPSRFSSGNELEIVILAKKYWRMIYLPSEQPTVHQLWVFRKHFECLLQSFRSQQFHQKYSRELPWPKI